MKKDLGGALIALAFVFGIIAAASTTVDAQWTNRSYGGYNTQQVQQGFQYGVNTGASDAQRRQTYSPQRSRYYRDAPTQAFRDGFVRATIRATGNTLETMEIPAGIATKGPMGTEATGVIVMVTTSNRNLTAVTSRV